MKLGPQVLSLILLFSAGCGKMVENTFVVSDRGENAISAELILCGSRNELSRTGHRFSGAKVIDCEGDGEIMVHFSNGREISCPVGYVTPNAKQDFEFVIENSQCKTVFR